MSRTGPYPLFDHVAHAAPSIRSLLPIYREQLGGEFLYGGVNGRVGYRAVNLAFPSGGKIELMEPLAGSDFFDRFFGRSPLGGLHHLTFIVEDFEQNLRRARDSGFEVVGVFTERPEWREAFIHPRSAHGTVIQIVQADADYPPMGLGGSIDEILAADHDMERQPQ